MKFLDKYINRVIHGDCLEVMASLPESSVDSIVTDPPYGLQFMGKEWDKLWRNGTDADKEYISRTLSSGDGLTARRRTLPDLKSTGLQMQEWHRSWAVEALRVLKPGGHLLAFGGSRTYHRMACAIEDAGFEVRDQIMWIYGSGFPKSLDVSKAIDKAAGAARVRVLVPTKRGNLPEQAGPISLGATGMTDMSVPVSDSARQWNGWGTALKPAHEPIVVARKPLIGTVAENVLTHGTGALNIDGCRVGASAEDQATMENGRKSIRSIRAGEVAKGYGMKPEGLRETEQSPLGRWPANVIHDGSKEVTLLFPQSNVTNSAARFFYCAKASKADRGENNHPTVKPTDLMRYLCRLVTPPGGIVLDPFAGSGSTLRGAFLEGFKPIGIELNEEYCRIARARMNLLTPAMAGLMG